MLERLRNVSPVTGLLLASVVFMAIAFGGLLLFVHANQVAGCERATQDRHDDAMGWRTAEEARRLQKEAAAPGSDEQAYNAAAEKKYAVIASSLESRTRPTEAERAEFCRYLNPLLR